MNVQSVDCRDADAGPRFVTSLRETGFAIVKSAPIPWQVLDRIYIDWLDFFLSDAKYEFECDPSTPEGTQRGFVPMEVSETAVGEELRDLKEFFHYRPNGDAPRKLAEDLDTYRKSAFEFGLMLMGWVKQNAPRASTARLPDAIEAFVCPQQSLLRVLHYPPIDAPGGAVRAAAHEDINLLTLLPASQQRGLEVQTIHGDWVAVSIEPRDMVVNTGDMLQEATDGFFPSTTHRVVNPPDGENVSRISIPYFLAPSPDKVLSERYTAGAYLAERLAEINR